jgi:kinetochore protein Fta7
MKDSIDLLKAEIAKEEALLADEKKALREMDKNAKMAEAERKRQTKNEHPILQQLGELPQIPDQTSEFTLLDTKGSQATLDEVRSQVTWVEAYHIHTTLVGRGP